MISLLQQTAPAAVIETPQTVVVTPVPADTVVAVPVDGATALVVPPDAALTPVTVATDAAHAAAPTGMPQLDVTTFGNQIFWLLVALAAIYFALSRIALPRLGRILADRQGLMTGDLSTAEDFKRKAREAEAAYERALADARTEAGKIVEANRAEMQKKLDAAVAQADAEIAARTAESEQRIGEIRASSARDARTVAQDVAAELVRTFGAQPDESVLNAAVDARMKGTVQ